MNFDEFDRAGARGHLDDALDLRELDVAAARNCLNVASDLGRSDCSRTIREIGGALDPDHLERSRSGHRANLRVDRHRNGVLTFTPLQRSPEPPTRTKLPSCVIGGFAAISLTRRSPS